MGRFTRQKHSVEGLSATWLLPIVAFIVVASTGGFVAAILPPTSARTTLIVSYINWGAGVPTAFLIMSLYLLRLLVHHVPPREQIVSVFLPLAPCGQGAFGIVQLGAVVRNLAWQDGVALLGDAATQGPEVARSVASSIFGASILVALVLYGLGWFWLVSALTIIMDMIRKGGFPFNMGWWSPPCLAHSSRTLTDDERQASPSRSASSPSRPSRSPASSGPRLSASSPPSCPRARSCSGFTSPSGPLTGRSPAPCASSLHLPTLAGAHGRDQIHRAGSSALQRAASA